MYLSYLNTKGEDSSCNIPTSMFFDFVTFAPPPRLFQPPRLLERWEYSFLPFDFNQGYFNQFEVLESQKWPLVDKTKSFYIKSALSFSDFQLLHGQKTVYSLQTLSFLEIIALSLQLCISFSVVNCGAPERAPPDVAWNGQNNTQGLYNILY